MTQSDVISVGVVGVCGGYGRGGHLTQTLQRNPAIKVQALCDIDQNGLIRANQEYGVEEIYFDYDEMLDQSKLDAVVIATPMHLHVPQSIAALRRGLHVLCEITAAVSVEECRDLVAVCQSSSAVYMLAENLNYSREVVAVRELVRRGDFGRPYFAEGGYIANAKGLAVKTPWRLQWQIRIRGIPYITHNLGPILQWMPGQRIEAVCCAGAGIDRAATDPTDSNAAIWTMLGRVTGGGQVVIRSDLLANRPSVGVYNDLQGTDGSYLSPRYPGEPHRIWLRSRSQAPQWEDLNDFADQVVPSAWRNTVADGPAGAYDGLMIADFVATIREEIPNPIGVHTALDLTIPGLVSQRSVAAGGEWLEVPDSRAW